MTISAEAEQAGSNYVNKDHKIQHFAPAPHTVSSQDQHGNIENFLTLDPYQTPTSSFKGLSLSREAASKSQGPKPLLPPQQLDMFNIEDAKFLSQDPYQEIGQDTDPYYKDGNFYYDDYYYYDFEENPPRNSIYQERGQDDNLIVPPRKRKVTNSPSSGNL